MSKAIIRKKLNAQSQLPLTVVAISVNKITDELLRSVRKQSWMNKFFSREFKRIELMLKMYLLYVVLCHAVKCWMEHLLSTLET